MINAEFIKAQRQRIIAEPAYPLPKDLLFHLPSLPKLFSRHGQTGCHQPLLGPLPARNWGRKADAFVGAHVGLLPAQSKTSGDGEYDGSAVLRR